MPEQDFDAFLDQLYAATSDPDLWVDVLATLADRVGGSSAWLSRLDAQTGQGTAIISRIDPAMVELYGAHFAGCNPLNNVSDPQQYWRTWTPRIITDEDWMPKEALMKSEFYNDFMRPQAVHATMMVRLAVRRPYTCVLNINRPKDRGPFDRCEIERVEQLHRHLIRAFDLSEKFAQLNDHGGDLALALNGAVGGLRFLNHHRRVHRLGPAWKSL